MNVTIPDDALDSIRRYSEVLIDASVFDDLTPKTREELRSYAVEALQRILRANPQHFDLAARLSEVMERKAGR